MKTITVFTPTFNRAYILPVLYNSLLNQTNKDFKWLVIDDGSSDNTIEIVNKWIADAFLDISFVRQENMGMVAAHNTAHHIINTELNVCIDSDDSMPVDGIERILRHWYEVSHKTDLMGLVGLDIYKDGAIIGDPFPSEVKFATFSEIRHKYKIKGDKKYVLRTDLVKSVLPYPFVKGEKFPAPSYLYLLLEKSYKFSLLNEPICIVEYLPDGNSMNKINQYKKSPNAFALYRIAKIKHAYNLKDKFINCIHYVSSKLLGTKKNLIKDSPAKFLTVLAIPFGVVLFCYILNKSGAVNKNLNKR